MCLQHLVLLLLPFENVFLRLHPFQYIRDILLRKEKSLNDDIKNKKQELEQAKFELDQAENKYDLERAAVLRHGDCWT